MKSKLQQLLWSSALVICVSFSSFAQTYTINTGGTVNTCSGTIYDSGGAGGSYAAGENYTMTFCSSTPGQCLRITFNSAPNLGTNDATPRDRINIYDGPTTAYANIQNINSNNAAGLTYPLTLTSSTGCITIRFQSNSGGSQGTGFAATISCVACPVQPIYNNPNGFVYTCNSLFYDSGSSGGNYGNNQNNRTTKFCSADGTCVRVTFTSFSTESGFDFLDIYDGNSIASPLIGSYSGTNSPGVVTASSGCLTFVFNSDNINVSSGWAATVSCVPCGTPPPPSQQNCNGGVTVCSNQTISGNSSGSGSIVDLGSSNDGCLYGENQSTWWYFSPATSGTIAFTIDPVNNSDDYDFAIWGPLGSVTCPPASAPVRCSYSALTDQTGLGNGAVDLSENSGGNSWVAPLAVNANDVYILVVDNYSETYQPYNLIWNLSGGATLDCTPLPVSFQEFLGQNKGTVNELLWFTSSENNNDYFVVERSRDAENWQFVTQVNAVGNSSEVSKYTAMDPSFDQGVINYYRLTQFDNDGKYRVLDVLSIDNSVIHSKLIKRINLLGQLVDTTYHGVVLEIYSDGTVVKSYQ